MPLQDLPLPDAVYARLPGAGRDTVLDHSIEVNTDRWRRVLDAHGLRPPTGILASGGKVEISRGQVFGLADSEPTAENALQLFWASLAWGLGLKGPRLTARVRTVADDSAGSATLLLNAWQQVRDGADPVSCYRALITKRGAGLIHGNGPAFATKFLYFAQGAGVPPRCLILDAVVAHRLSDELRLWPKAPTAGWYPDTYARYCNLMQRWSREATERSSHLVLPDEIEMTLFLWRDLPTPDEPQSWTAARVSPSWV
jgi:hypothetical protein